MAGAVLYRLHFRSPLHIGERGVGLEETRTHVPADTLFSALCTAWRWLYGVDSLRNDLLSPFLNAEQPPFLLTSAFPFAGDILFFPKPSALKGREEEEKLKKVRYISQGVLSWWVQTGNPLDTNGMCLASDGAFLVGKTEWQALEPFIDDETSDVALWRVAVVPRVTLDRQTSASQIWFFGQVAFKKNAGLWCAIRYRDEGLRHRAEACLRLLGDSGLGGERGSGFGLFAVEVSEMVSLPEAEEAGYCVTLSPCCPTAQQIQTLIDDRCAYDLLPRRGWIGSPEGGNLRRKSVWMLSEGSVLRWTNGAVPGCLVNVKPEPCPHDVWRYGYAFPLGVRV